MTAIGVVGAGTAARLHAEATMLARGHELVGVGGGASRGADLASELGVRHLQLEDLCRAADSIVLAVPSRAMPELVASISGRVEAVLLEAPHRLALEGPALYGCNLMHAPATAPALRAITQLNEPHHLTLRASRPGDARVEARRLAPLLFAAASLPVMAVEIEVTGADRVAVVVVLDDGRRARLEVTTATTGPFVELEAADDHGVVSLRWDPGAHLEVDASPVDLGGADHPLVDLGYVGQIHRLADVSAGRADPWPTTVTGAGIEELLGPRVGGPE